MNDQVRKDDYWSSLLESGGYQPDPATLLQMRQKLDLERSASRMCGFEYFSPDPMLSKGLDPDPDQSQTGSVTLMTYCINFIKTSTIYKNQEYCVLAKSFLFILYIYDIVVNGQDFFVIE